MTFGSSVRIARTTFGSRPIRLSLKRPFAKTSYPVCQNGVQSPYSHELYTLEAANWNFTKVLEDTVKGNAGWVGNTLVLN